MKDSVILREQPNLFETKVAILEADGDNDSIYLYVFPPQTPNQMHALWVANCSDRDAAQVEEQMRAALPPRLPHADINEVALIADLEPDNWDVRWSLDQQSVAVWHLDRIVAIMPSWGPANRFPGFAIGCKGETPVAWPLTDENVLLKRFTQEDEFLRQWGEDSWRTIQQGLLDSYKSLHTDPMRYFAADQGKWPPLAITLSSKEGRSFMATAGMAILPMPGAEADDSDTRSRRIELGILCDSSEADENACRALSGLARYPWRYATHFDHGHTIPTEAFADVAPQFTHFATAETASFLPPIQLPQIAGEQPRFLFLIPITAAEQKMAENRGTQRLLELLEASPAPLSLQRDPVA
ncbi:suppressor of fused domain protein [Blastopirellula sp. JC732]|uniref:Suppressor of fused domain protein n=1 Tax=Blastopirellula sediminis TaxID=2894196 RepID=A0A9X1SGL7_9BACT|nr:suppressor of fused domain protein [Blastopirellula sediminis]MCC9607595.1 suppressor of fused domain protein [Blastopirellula sediminis]MCC9629112.1 suppressor of fused domain protein [Blastopirellula sediminis]